ncbi:MAG: hypothetical protein IT536_06250 [Hyphomicrobiales bacterium]|nr:hypothetical protein [Hyphomicrobiales bacterium]
MSDRNPSEPSRPRSEPEIIPPRRSRPNDGRRLWVSVDEADTARIYLARPSPLSIVLALAVLALIAMLMLIVLLSVAVIWIPVVLVLVATLVLSMTLRRYWWQLRSWWARR